MDIVTSFNTFNLDFIKSLVNIVVIIFRICFQYIQMNGLTK